MKNIGISIIVLLILVDVSWGQSKFAVGLEAGLSVPTGSTSDKYEVAFGAGAFAIIPLSSQTVAIVIGADYLSMAGKTTTETKTYNGPTIFGTITTTTSYNDLQVTSIYAGPKIGGESGAYFLPALSFNSAKDTRFGLYLGGGFLLPLNSIKLNLAARYGILNLFGRDEGEDIKDGIGIYAGVVF